MKGLETIKKQRIWENEFLEYVPSFSPNYFLNKQEALILLA